MTVLSPYRYKTHRGFTLVELVTVLVILGLVASIGSSFFVNVINSYDQVQSRSKLINRGRLVIEQMTRQIRMAAPNSIRVGASGRCVEFLPMVAGVRYITDFSATTAVSSVSTAPYSFDSGIATHVLIGALDSTEIYTTGSPSGRVGAGDLESGTTYTAITFETSHLFNRNSITRRAFITDNPLRFCLVGETLVRYSNYGLTTLLDEINPAPGGSTSAIMGENITTSSQAFTVSLGIEERNTALSVSLNFSGGGEQVSLNQKILVRNVP